jgi:Holliday junction resolvasome RuvABC DNA-binding subunit
VNLGYQPAAAEKAIDTVVQRSNGAGFEASLREVLRGLIKG